MRLTDERYSRDRQRHELALRFIQNEARTRTTRCWTGLTDDRIRKLYRAFVDTRAPLRRRRGKSPQQPDYFLRSRPLQRETAALGALLLVFGVVPAAPLAAAARPLPGVARGERLCDAFEAYRRISPQAPISFEHAVFLATSLVAGTALRLQACRHCRALAVVDPLALRAPACLACDRPLRLPGVPPGAAVAAGARATGAAC
jgi:hypothetical protein